MTETSTPEKSITTDAELIAEARARCFYLGETYRPDPDGDTAKDISLIMRLADRLEDRVASPSSPPSSDWVLVPRRQLTFWTDLLYDSRNVSIVYGEIKALLASPPPPSVGTVTREMIAIVIRDGRMASAQSIEIADAVLALLNPKVTP